MDELPTSDSLVDNRLVHIDHHATADTSVNDSDLINSKTELFNKLITNQLPQQMNATTVNNQTGVENLNSVVKSSTGIETYQQTTGVDDEHQQLRQDCQPPQSGTGKPHQANKSQLQQFLPEDFKREPVVFSKSRSRWYTNEEVASILTHFSSHPEWQTNELQIRPKSGAVLLYSREKVRYRQDGYCWKKRKNGRTTREDHMKLKVQGIECIYGCYVHSAILPTFHRRCYWLLQNPDIVLVHYLNQPPDDPNKMMITFNSSLLEADTRRSWTNDEIIEEIGSVFGGISQIQHMLNVNFPHSPTVLQQNQLGLQPANPDRVVESSPMSEHSQATTNSEAMNEQVDMTIGDHQQDQQSHGVAQSATEHLENEIDRERRQCDGVRDEGEIMMTTVSQDNNNNDIADFQSDAGDPNNLDHANRDSDEGKVNGHEQQDDSISMTFDVVNECNNGNNMSTSQQNVDCFVYANPNNIGIGNVDVTIDDNNNNGSSSNSINRPPTDEPSNEPMEQNPCSPVTQIYNKIVDDIETYALPLEPNQFNSSHHHGLTITAHSMDISGSNESHNHHMHQQHQQQQQQYQQLDQGQHHHQRASQMEQQFVHHHQRVGNNLSVVGINSGSEINNGKNTNDNQNNNCANDNGEMCGRVHDDGDSDDRGGGGCENHQRDNEDDNIHGAHAACSMDLTSCDLFGNECNQVDLSGHSQGQDVDGGLLLSEFNMPADGVNEELEASVVDSMANVDDLSDLIMGISSNGSVTDDHNNLLVATNSLDLFNFKTASCGSNMQQTQHQLQQLDVKSSTSDTDALNRLSPMIGHVPRCNSTGNATRPKTQLSSDHQRQHQHLSSNFLTCTQNNLAPGNFNELQHRANSSSNNNSSHRSSSTNQSSSTSCSPSPSSLSLRGGLANQLSSNQSACLGDAQYTAQTASSLQSFIKLPLQQRQQSEQQEPSNSVLNSLLPKALSLDGGDLSVNNNRVLNDSPLIAYSRDSQDYQQQQNTMLISLAMYQQQNQSANPSITSQNLASYSTNIPLDNSSEILVNTLDNFQGSPAYNLYQQPQQQQQHHQQQQNQVECNKNFQAVLPILEYVPNWCNITGGAKILIVGNWSSLLEDNTYQYLQSTTSTTSLNKDGSAPPEFYAIFDDLSVPATLIQDNVLRCYAPSHEQGFITLKVVYMNRIVSEQVLFEMRPSCIQTADATTSNKFNNNNNDGGNNQDKFNDNNGNKNTQQQQHRNSSTTSSNQHQSTGVGRTLTAGQKTQTASSSSSQLSSGSSSESNTRVLTLAENIISAMRKKNTTFSSSSTPNPGSLTASFDVDSSNHYKQLQPCQRHYSLKIMGNQRRIFGSRSLSRDSELNCSNYGNNNSSMNFGELIDGDPYWHQSSTRQAEMQPLSIVTDFLPTTSQQQNAGSSSHAYNQQVSKQHSNGPSAFVPAQQQSAFVPYNPVQRPSLVSIHPQTQPHMQQHQQQQLHYHHNHQHQLIDSQNLTETSSSGLGSIVSSLSPSTSSLHSPSSACTATGEGAGSGRDCLSPSCSCGGHSLGTPTSADFCEYFQASAKTESSFASLTLNDREQQELFEAAKIIQKAYRTYRGRKRQASELLVEPSSDVAVKSEPVAKDHQVTHLRASPMQHQHQIDLLCSENQQVHAEKYHCPASHYGEYLSSGHTNQEQPQQQTVLIKCYHDQEMHAATIIQAYYRRYRQYVHFKRQQAAASGSNKLAGLVNSGACGVTGSGRLSPNARLVVDTIPIVIDKATTTHVDRKRFKTAILVSANSGSAISDAGDCLRCD